MIKMLYAWKDNPDRTPDECEEHYRRVHMELAQAAFRGVDGFRALRYSRVRRHMVNNFNAPEEIAEEPDVDAFVELYFDSTETLQAAFGRPELGAMFDDHPNFMAVDVPKNVRIYELDETTILEVAGPSSEAR